MSAPLPPLRTSLQGHGSRLDSGEYETGGTADAGLGGGGGRGLSRRRAAISGAVERMIESLTRRADGVRINSVDGVEPLEPRQLFTTLVGGDTFEYTAPDPANPGTRIRNRIVLTGNVVAELVGGSLDPTTGAVALSDVPGHFYDSGIGRSGEDFLGGPGGGSGVEPVVSGGTTGVSIVSNPPFNNNGNVPYNLAGSAAFNTRATATDSAGNVYLFNVVRSGVLGTAGETAILQLVKLTRNSTTGQLDAANGNVVAELNTLISGATGSNFLNANGVEAVTAAAYNPVDGNIYFVVRGNNQGNFAPAQGQPAPTLTRTQQLFRLNPTNPTGPVTAFQGTFNRTTNNDTAVTALAFDQVGGSATLYGYILDSFNNAGRGRIFQVNTTPAGTTNTIINPVLVRTNQFTNTSLTAITGLAFLRDNVSAAETTIFAVESATAGSNVAGVTSALASTAVGPQVLSVNLSSGIAAQFGPLPQTAQQGQNTTVTHGANLQSLTFLANVRDPFTSRLGAMVAVDNTTDELVFVDTRNRFPNTAAFALYISQSDANSSIVVGTVANPDPQKPNDPRPMQPFAGSAGTLRITSAAGDGVVNLTSPAGIGGVFLGLKTSGNQNADLNNIPVIVGTLANSLGVRPAGTVNAGIVSSQSLLQALTNQTSLSTRLLGSTVSDVTGVVVTYRSNAAVGAAGSILAIDSDGRDANGNFITNDQLVVIDRTTGKATNVRDITNSVTGLTVSNNRGMTIDDNERILAVFLQTFADQQTNTGGGSTLPGTYPDFNAAGQQALSLSISGAGPTGYILAQSASQKFLYSFSNIGGSLKFTSLGPIVDADNATIAAANDLGVSNTGKLYTVGFSRGNPLPTQSTGGLGINLANTDTRALTYASDGQLYILSASGQGLQIQRVNRDLASGAITNIAGTSSPVTTPVLISINGSAVQGVSDLSPDPVTAGNLVGIGSTSGSLVPATEVGTLTQKDGTSDFLYRGLTRLNSTDIYAVTFNGSTLDLRKTVLVGTPLATTQFSFNTVPSTARSQADGSPGTDIRYDANPSSGRGATTAVLGINATTHRPGDSTNLYAVGYSADALIPTQPVLGTLGTGQNGPTASLVNVQQMAVRGFSPVYSYNDTTTLPLLGGIAYGLTRFVAATRDTATGGLQGQIGRSQTMQIVGQSPPQQTGIFSYQGPIGADIAQIGFGTVVNTIVDTHALAVDRVGGSTYLTSGFNIDSPVPAAPIKGNLGSFFGVDPASGESNLRGLAIGDPVAAGQLQDMYATLFNGTGTDIYRLTRSPVDNSITSFAKVNSGSSIRDPRNPDNSTNIINFVYSIWKDPNTAGRFFLIGSSSPTSTGPAMTLYAIDIVGGVATVNNTDQPPVDITLNGQPARSSVFKAGAINAAGQMFVVRDNSGVSPAVNTNGTVPSSSLFLLDRTTGALTNYGFLVTATFASSVPGVGGAWTAHNSNVRAIQFHTDTDGDEKLVLLDQPQDGGGSVLSELDFANIKAQPQVAVGGVPANVATMPVNPLACAVALQSSLGGMVDSALTTFTIDQYGRGFSIKPGTSAGNPDRIWTSPNEIYAQDSGELGDEDGDNWVQENVRIGWLVNEDGTAFTDSVTTWTGTLDGNRLVGVVKNNLLSSNHPGDPLFGKERLYSLIVPGGVDSPTTANNSGTNSAQRITFAPVRRVNTPADNGLISVNNAAGGGTDSNLTGLAIDINNSLIGLDGTTATGFRLVGLQIDAPTSDTALLTGNPTFNTLTITDRNATPFVTVQSGQTVDPRGLGSDLFGRFYTADGGTITAGQPTRLLVSSNTVSLFQIDTATALATKVLDLADDSQLQQTPVLSRFTGIAFSPTDSNLVYLVQKDIRSTSQTAVTAEGLAGVDRLVTLSIPGSVSGPVAFTRYNNAATAGAIQVGNTIQSSNGTTNGTPTNITAIDFTSNGQLIGLDNGLRVVNGTGIGAANRLVRIELDTTSGLAPTNSVYATDPNTVTGFAGLSALGTQLASISTGPSPDRLLFSNNALSLFSVVPATGATTVRGQLVDPNGNTLGDERPVTAVATQPTTTGTLSGFIYAIFRGTDAGTGTPADFLYQINATTGLSTLVGQVRLTTDQNGNAITPVGTNIIALSFSAERDAKGNYVLMAVNDPAGANNRQLVSLSLTSNTVSGTVYADAAAIPGSDPGEFSDNYLGFVSDVTDTDTTRLPLADRGRFFTLDTTFPSSVQLNVTPTRLYTYNTQSTVNGTNVAQFQTVGDLVAPNSVVAPSGGAILDTIKSIDFNPAGQLYLARQGNVATPTTTLLTIASTNGYAGIPASTVPQNNPRLSLSLVGAVQVASASTVALTGQTLPTLTGTNVPALVSDIFFLADGTLRSVATLQGENLKRLVDIPVGNTAQSVARTNPGVPSATLIGFDEFTDAGGISRIYAIDNSTPTTPLITTPSTDGSFGTVVNTSTQTGSTSGVLGSPTLGILSLNSTNTTSASFSPLNTGSAQAPGRLPSSITDVKALAYDRVVNRTRTSQGLYIVDQNNTLIRLNLDATGTTLLGTTTIGVIRDSISQQTINVGSMTFDPDGRLLVQDLDNSRLVDVSTSTALAGAVTATATGTLPQTVGAIGYDPIANRFIAVDNVTGINTTSTGSVSSIVDQIPFSLTASAQDIGKIFIGGTVPGRVSLSGSVGTFYAGWLITGQVSGISNTLANPDPANFYVDGNLGQLITTGPIGTGTVPANLDTNTYRTGTDVLVKGSIGSVRGLSDSFASYRAMGQTVTTTVSADNSEIENRAIGAGQNEAVIAGDDFQKGILRNPGFNNDTFATAQRLYPDPATGVATVTGTLESFPNANDFADYYAFPVLGGQTIFITFTGSGDWGLFDPDGRLVMTDYVETNTPGGSYKYTTDRPGEYRIAVARVGDINFNGASDTGEKPLTLGSSSYDLSIYGLGTLAVANVQFAGTFVDPSPPTATGSQFDFSAVYAAQGDVGALSATRILGFSNGAANTVRAAAGSIRSVDAGSIGELFNGSYRYGMNYSANGDVGLIRSGGILLLNEAVTSIAGDPTGTSNVGAFANFNPDFTRVRGSIQKIQSAGQYVGYLFADKALGTLAIGSADAVGGPGYINVNADQTGNDGTIDLIDCGGNLGNIADGGIVIYTNGGGNVRYMRVRGLFFRDRAFGGGTISTITYTAGNPVSVTDDSGAKVTIDFNTDLLTPNPNYDSTDPTSFKYLNPPQISLATYPIRSGGAVIISASVNNLTSTISNPDNLPLLRISSSGNSNQGVEIGSLSLTGTSAAVVVDANGTFAITGSTNTGNPTYSLGISGNVPVSVANITINGSINSITNSTGGELLGLSATSVGTLSTTGDLGIAKVGKAGIVPLFTYTGGGTGGTGGTTGIGNSYPFAQQENIIQPGAAIRISANGAIANIYATNIDRLIANADSRDDASRYEGINGPVISTGIINSVNIGEGILPSGYGNVGGGMIVARGRINSVGGNGDVRGVIASETSINSISINGAIINTSIAVFTPNSSTNEFFSIAPVFANGGITQILADSDNTNSAQGTTAYELTSVRATQGMIGVRFVVSDINSITADGFGLINCQYIASGGNRINSVLAGGYGIRGGFIEPGNSVGSIKTRSLNGAPLSTSNVTASVRRSEFETIDSYFGIPVSKQTDIHAYLGTSAAVPLIDGVTSTGVIEDLVATGVGSLGEISAWQIRGSVPGTTNTRLAFTQSIGTVRSVAPIDGLTIRTGKLNTFAPKSDVSALDLTVSGPISNFTVSGTVGSNSVISSTGPNASIGTFNIKGNFDGSLTSAGKVGKVSISGNLTNGSINITPSSGARGLALSSLTVGGTLSAASLNITGDVGTISVAGSLGQAGDTLSLTGNLNTLNVGTNKKLPPGRELAMAITVGGSIGSVNVNGRITGALTAAGSIRNIRVQSDGDDSTALVAAAIRSTSGDIGTVNLTGGDLGAPITAFNRINSITLNKGNTAPGSEISTTASQIGTVTVKNGNILGNIRSGTSAAPQAINSITTTGQLGDGTNALNIHSASLRNLKVGLSVYSQVNVRVDGTLSSLVITNDLLAGSVIQAHAISSIKIGGKRDGQIIIA